MKKLFFALLFAVLNSCDSGVDNVNPGEIKYIPNSCLYAVGTDSTIVIIDRSSGKITDIVYRFK